jgi:hypothetical protein
VPILAKERTGLSDRTLSESTTLSESATLGVGTRTIPRPLALVVLVELLRSLVRCA